MLMQIKFPVQESKSFFSFGLFLWQKKERIALGLVAVAMGTIFLVKGATGKDKLFSEFMQASAYQVKSKAGKEFDQNGLAKLLKKHPELKPVFSHYLEQNFAIIGDLSGVKTVSEETLKRLSFIDPIYKEYAKASLLIEEGKYEEALANAIQMKASLVEASSPNLYGLNLIRISFLESLLGKKGVKMEEKTISRELRAHLQDDQLSLLDFIQK